MKGKKKVFFKFPSNQTDEELDQFAEAIMDNIKEMIRDEDIDKMAGGILGAAVGDALGVPVEFMSREEISRNPITGMTGGGNHGRPPGTWSDDTSMLLCHMQSLLEKGYDRADAMNKFVAWWYKGLWKPAPSRQFGIGNIVDKAMRNYMRDGDIDSCGLQGVMDNGNGSLMRILPVSLYFRAAADSEMMAGIAGMSNITHAHPRSILACVIFTVMVQELLKGHEAVTVYDNMRGRVPGIIKGTDYGAELGTFDSILNGTLPGLKEEQVKSSGYVVDTLEASLWCLLNSGSFAEAVLKAVNLGGDSDTSGAVAGGLAGVCYGFDVIPGEWLDKLARLEDILSLTEEFILSSD
jgi:ADP-ribosylglycohydrolase